jgi:Na+/melibiose symporter-like transporter
VILFLYLLAPGGNFYLVAACAAAAGLPYSAINLLPRAMMADVADLERLNCGAERTGLLFALLIGTWKVGQALSVGLMLMALARIGFNPAPGTKNSPGRSIWANLALRRASLSTLYSGLFCDYALFSERDTARSCTPPA